MEENYSVNVNKTSVTYRLISVNLPEKQSSIRKMYKYLLYFYKNK